VIVTLASDSAISPNPTAADVDKYAAAFEEKYPGYGARLMRLAFGTGLRINEALAPRWDSIGLDTLNLAVDWQTATAPGPRWRCRRATSRAPRNCEPATSFQPVRQSWDVGLDVLRQLYGVHAIRRRISVWPPTAVGSGRPPRPRSAPSAAVRNPPKRPEAT
jgi:hypothetical protein